MQGTIRKASAVTLLIGTAAVVLVGAAAFSQTATVTKPATVVKPPFPPHSGILNGYEKVVSTADGQRSLYTVYVKKAEGKMLAELPSSYATQKHFIAMTIASGERMAGLQAGDLYVYWKRYDKRLALIEPNLGTRSTGDPESVNSVKRLFTDRVILDVPILTMGPQGGPVIDMQELLVKALDHLESRNVLLVRIEALDQNAVGPDYYPRIGFQKVATQIHYAMPIADRRI